MMQNFDSKKSDSNLNDIKIPIRIACNTPMGYPIVVSLWYTMLHGKIYCATKRNAKIITYLKNNPQVGFEIAADKPPYRGIRGHGKVKIIEDIGKDILEILIEKYLGNKISTLSKFLRNNLENEIAIEITYDKLLTYDYSKRMRDI